jgi:KDO2-lipid IV(A) lauroyltransferase
VSSVYYLARAGNTMSRWTPQAARHALGSVAGVASYLGWRSKRVVTQLNMAQVSGRPAYDPYVKRLALASWRNYGRYASDFMHFPHMDMETIEQQARDITCDAGGWPEYVQQALAKGRGVILATAHFGSWDMAGALFARRFSLSAVAETFEDARLNSLLQNQRIEKGIGIIPMEGSARRILRVLQENKLVGIVVDRPVSKEEGVEVKFFGRSTYVPGGPAALAIKSGAAILPGYVWYGHHNAFYERAFPPIFPQTGKGTDKAAEIARLTQYMYDALEEMVRQWPTQWYMFRQFWPSLPQ